MDVFRLIQECEENPTNMELWEELHTLFKRHNIKGPLFKTTQRIVWDYLNEKEKENRLKELCEKAYDPLLKKGCSFRIRGVNNTKGVLHIYFEGRLQCFTEYQGDQGFATKEPWKRPLCKTCLRRIQYQISLTQEMVKNLEELTWARYHRV